MKCLLKRLVVAIFIPALLAGCTADNQLLEKGRSLLRERKFDQAEQEFERVCNENKKCCEAFYYLAVANVGTRRYVEALQHLNDAVHIDPNYAPAYSERALVYTRLKQADKALADIQHALQLQPDSAKHHHRLGIIYLELKDYPHAIAEFNAAERLDPKDSPFYLHLNRAESYLGADEPKKALVDFDKAISLAPSTEANTFLRRAVCRARLKNFKGALEDCDTALARGIDSFGGYSIKASILSLSGDSRQATVLFKKVLGLSARPPGRECLEIDPKQAHPHADLARAYFESGNPKLAVGEYKKLQGMRPLESNEAVAFAKALIALKDYPLATSTLNSALSSDPDCTPARIELIRCYLAAGLRAKAQEIGREGIAIAHSAQDRLAIGSLMR